MKRNHLTVVIKYGDGFDEPICHVIQIAVANFFAIGKVERLGFGVEPKAFIPQIMR